MTDTVKTDQPDGATATLDAVPGASTPPAPAVAQAPAAAKGPKLYYRGTGRRKTAVARIRLGPGDGKFFINGRELTAYLTEDRDRRAVVAPLEAAGVLGKMDVLVRVDGGGFTGQTGAIVLGVARALLRADSSFESVLRDGGYLTRDDRKVERKKPGMSGARKRFQFSKR